MTSLNGYPEDLFDRLIKARCTLLRTHQQEGLWDALEAVKDVPGDLVETGVMHGGGSIVMAVHNQGVREQWMFDSWNGFPEDRLLTYGRLPEDKKHSPGKLKSELKRCRENFEEFDAVFPGQHFVQGAFSETTKDWDRPTALLRLDGDLYSSTREVLENMYPSLSPGGICIIDDWCFAACRRAVDEYREKHGIAEEIVQADGSKLEEPVSGVWWRKC